MKTTKLRKLVPYGYVVASGRVMLDIHVDAYNATQERINAFIEGGRTIPEYELHDSFSRIQAYMMPGVMD